MNSQSGVVELKEKDFIVMHDLHVEKSIFKKSFFSTFLLLLLKAQCSIQQIFIGTYRLPNTLLNSGKTQR